MAGSPSFRVTIFARTDFGLLFATRILRMFAYGFLSVVLVFYLISLGLSESQVGLLLTLTLLGDTAISLLLTYTADRLGRRRMLAVGAVLMVLAGVLFAVTDEFLFLLIAAIIGVISPSGNEVGPFLAIEQAALSQLVTDEKRTAVFAWYNLVGSLATAAGALMGGGVAAEMVASGATGPAVYRPLIVAYGVVGLLLAVLFLGLSSAAEVHAPTERRVGLHRSRRIVFKLAGLFAMDAFGGGFVIQSFVAYWFALRFEISPQVIGSIFFGANVLAGVSALLAARIAKRIGLVKTMVFTHLPSNVLLLLVPLMPTLELAILVLLMRFSISQMDVPTRQAYTMAVVAPDERSAASGFMGVARSLGAAAAPILAGLLLADARLMDVPFYLAGGIKIVYDVLLLWVAGHSSDSGTEKSKL